MQKKESIGIDVFEITLNPKQRRKTVEQSNFKCPQCNEPLTTIARGRDMRVHFCTSCPEDTAYYLQETTRLKAARPIKLGKLIELSTSEKS